MEEEREDLGLQGSTGSKTGGGQKRAMKGELIVVGIMIS
jgi:hypothetical protein